MIAIKKLETFDGVREHRHESIEIVFITGENGTHTINDSEYPVGYG